MKVGIIGGGVSGLIAGYIISQNPDINVVVFEKGKPQLNRSRTHSFDIQYGVGGAGLFSDGKFSFYPAGTKLYELCDKDTLQQGLIWLYDLLSIHPQKNYQTQKQDTDIFEKIYPVVKLNYDKRLKIINRLTLERKNFTIAPNSTVIAITQKDKISITLKNGKIISNFNKIIVATGKFGSLSQSIYPSNVVFSPIRYEIGVRIEAKNTSSFFQQPQLDIKSIWKHEGLEYRTFCTCRNGEIWNLLGTGFPSLSGRSNETNPTNYSNFGFLIRYEGDMFSSGKKLFLQALSIGNNAIWQDIFSYYGYPKIASQINRPWYHSNTYIMGDLNEILQPSFNRHLIYGLDILRNNYGDLFSNMTKLIFPAIEGVGYYPVINKNFQTSNESVYCVGDNVGIFRGLVPAMLSGYICGTHILNSQ